MLHIYLQNNKFNNGNTMKEIIRLKGILDIIINLPRLIITYGQL